MRLFRDWRRFLVSYAWALAWRAAVVLVSGTIYEGKTRGVETLTWISLVAQVLGAFGVAAAWCNLDETLGRLFDRYLAIGATPTTKPRRLKWLRRKFWRGRSRVERAQRHWRGRNTFTNEEFAELRALYLRDQRLWKARWDRRCHSRDKGLKNLERLWQKAWWLF